MSFALSVNSQFSAAHAIRGYEGKCENLHGHNFYVEITVRGDQLDPGTGMLIDFAILKKALGEAIAPLDHAVLNEIPEFVSKSPSSENIAVYIGTQLQKILGQKAQNARLYSVSVSEKHTQTATWFA